MSCCRISAMSASHSLRVDTIYYTPNDVRSQVKNRRLTAVITSCLYFSLPLSSVSFEWTRNHVHRRRRASANPSRAAFRPSTVASEAVVRLRSPSKQSRPTGQPVNSNIGSRKCLSAYPASDVRQSAAPAVRPVIPYLRVGVNKIRNAATVFEVVGQLRPQTEPEIYARKCCRQASMDLGSLRGVG